MLIGWNLVTDLLIQTLLLGVILYFVGEGKYRAPRAVLCTLLVMGGSVLAELFLRDRLQHYVLLVVAVLMVAVLPLAGRYSAGKAVAAFVLYFALSLLVSYALHLSSEPDEPEVAASAPPPAPPAAGRQAGAPPAQPAVPPAPASPRADSKPKRQAAPPPPTRPARPEPAAAPPRQREAESAPAAPVPPVRPPAAVQPQDATSALEPTDPVRIRRALDELAGWQDSRIAWHPLLAVLGLDVPAPVSFSRVEVDGQLRAAEGPPLREFRLVLQGRARGQSANSAVEQLLKQLAEHPSFRACHANLRVDAYRLDSSPGALRTDRAFSISARFPRRALRGVDEQARAAGTDAEQLGARLDALAWHGVLKARAGQDYAAAAKAWLALAAAGSKTVVSDVRAVGRSRVPGAGEHGREFDVYLVRASAKGGFEQLIDFLRRLEANRCLCVNDLVLAAGADGTHELQTAIQWPVWADAGMAKTFGREKDGKWLPGPGDIPLESALPPLARDPMLAAPRAAAAPNAASEPAH
ncbi:MAG: hypothetical protein JXR37_15800 [Kiritimatiellae bacterium]|nr:hypothetical protein [Kiritimatiellia bacterium]